MNAIEIIGFITAVLGIYLTAKKNIYAWPILIISSLAYAFFFFEIKLYADTILQFFFVATSAYAWFNWNKNIDESNKLNVRRFKNREWVPVIFYILFASIIVAKFLSKYTDGTFVELDSILFISSVAASILSAKLYLENWYFWIVINFSYIVLYVFKDAYLTALLYSVLLGLAFVGLKEWRKQYYA